MIRRTARDRSPPGELMPPEGVPLKLKIAGLGVRLAAQLTDILLTGFGALAIVIFLAATDIAAPQTLMAVGALLFFVIRIPYYVLSELVWNGQTLGKRFMKIKVVAHDGGSLTTHAIVLRNLMKEAEIFLPGTLLVTLDTATPVASGIAFAWIIGVLLVPLMNRYRMRLGDLMAGTHVIHLPEPLLLKDLAAAPQAATRKDGFTFLPYQLDHYGAFELQTLEGLLRAQDSNPYSVTARNQRKTAAAIVEKIRAKIGYADPVPEADQLRFLNAFYNAQRAHLEQRQLFGDRRADKYHAGSDAGS